MNNLLFLPIKIYIPDVIHSIYSIDDNLYDLGKEDYFETWSATIFKNIDEVKKHPSFKIIIEQLPFKQITLFKQNVQLKDAMAHVDVNINNHSKGHISNEEHDNILKN